MTEDVDREHNPQRKNFYDRIAHQNLKPLWEVLHELITPEPRSKALPTLWDYETLRPYLLESGSLISTEEAERRVLILENPGLAGRSAITQSLYAGLQLILPGETAPSHRHSQSALRFVLEGNGAFTTVDGEQTLMQPGDFVITPAWTSHDHGNDTDTPMVWLDGLDIPLVSFLDASFAQGFGGKSQRLTRPIGDSLARFGSGLLPVDYSSSEHRSTSPVFNYPYSRSREALEQLSRRDAWDPCHGIKLFYVNPTNGDYAMPTIAAFLQLLPKQFETAPYRSTDGTVYVCVEGSGTTTIENKRYDWGPRDIFVVPSWTRHTHLCEAESVLFSFSDRSAQQKLGIWQEERDGQSD